MIRELINNSLLKEQERSNQRIRSGRWNPSSFGRCYRYQFWNRKDEPVSNALDADTLRKFAIGKMIHSWVQEIVCRSTLAIIESGIDTADCSAFVDIELQDSIVEIKSVRSFAFKLMKKEGYDVTEDKLPNILQLMYYVVEKGKSTGILYFIDKDSMEDREFEFKVEDWKDTVQEELEILNGYWKQDKLPPALARCFHGKECGYCGFHNHCLKIEGGE